MDVGYIIICVDSNSIALKTTVNSLKSFTQDRQILAVVGSNVTKEDLKELSQYCSVHKAKSTITSLINVGMKKITSEWGFLLFAGSRIPMYLENKFHFAKQENDVLYPIVNRKCNFVDGSFNGVMINRKFFSKVGNFPEITMKKEGLNDFEMAKLFWATDAIDHGAKFKGIVGIKII